jgi:hypothetical protein
VVRKAIIEAQATIETRYVDLAALLSEAYHKTYYKDWGFEEGIGGWKDYCAKELDTHYRKSMYYIEIHDKIKALDLSPKDLVGIGWSKMKEIVSVMTTKNAEAWLKKACELSVRDLTEQCKLIRRKKGNIKDDRPSITTMKLTMEDSEARIITDATTEAKAMQNSDNTVAALVMICQDWQEAKGVTPQVATLEDHVAFLEKQFNVTITFKKRAVKDKEPVGAPPAPNPKVKKDAKLSKAAKKAGKEAATAAADEMADILTTSGGEEGADQDIDAALGLT